MSAASRSLAAINDEAVVQLDANELEEVLLHVAGGGAWTVQLQMTGDGSTWVTTRMTNLNSGAVVTDMTAAGMYRTVIPAAAAKVRARMTALSAGGPVAASLRTVRAK